MKAKHLGITLMIAGFVSCQQNAITGRRGLNLLPETEMIGMSLTEYNKFLSEHPALPASDSRVVMVRGIGSRIQQAVEKYYAEKGLGSQLQGYKWEFNVVEDPTVNAWCMPGGKVVVYTGILPVTQDEASLAIVMGHEIAHAVAKHGNERMSQGMITQFGATALSVATQQKPALTQAIFQQSYGMASQLGILKYSRTHETEADKMGLVFAAMAGYDPEVAVGFWQRMAKLGGSQKPIELLSTHPSDETRINTLKSFMPEAKKYYKPK
jgi:predicted Zn-dependent protease